MAPAFLINGRANQINNPTSVDRMCYRSCGYISPGLPPILPSHRNEQRPRFSRPLSIPHSSSSSSWWLKRNRSRRKEAEPREEKHAMPPRVAIRRINDSALAATFPCPVRRVSPAFVIFLQSVTEGGKQAPAIVAIGRDSVASWVHKSTFLPFHAAVHLPRGSAGLSPCHR